MRNPTRQPNHRTRPDHDVDIVVIGAGHAGCEAALAAARMGCRTLVVTPNLDRVGYMPCNPSIGGPGKSQIVAEVDALGGAMAEVADAAALQLRMLNTSKGPAVQSLRAQVDKTIYAMLMKGRLESQPNLALLQDEAVALEVIDDASGRRVTGVRLRQSGAVRCAAVVVTAGTFLRAAMVAGEDRQPGGRSGERADDAVAASLIELGIPTRRFKTGTPPRVDARSVDPDRTELQLGDDVFAWFSDAGQRGQVEPVLLPPAPTIDRGAGIRGGRLQLACHRLSTNHRTHEVVRANLHRAPMFNGAIDGVGPRYCPSIEDKVARFSEKPGHPVFLEPEGWRSGELYVQGMSTSLPTDVQLEALRTIHGLEKAVVTRYGYAVEYDAVAPSALSRTLELRGIAGLFLAGQVNGTSGYEEAAGQGILAGINAGARVTGRPPVELRRDQAYIGVMVDDLTSRPFTEPYRMLTARAEFRLTLRSTTAQARLGSLASEYGLVSSDRSDRVRADEVAVEAAVRALDGVRLLPSAAENERLAQRGEPAVSKPMTGRDLGRRPGMTLARLHALLEPAGMDVLGLVDSRLHQRLQEQLQFAGFAEREAREAHRLGSIGMRPLMIVDYADVPGLRIEARQQLAAAPVSTFGDAQRLSGVTPGRHRRPPIHSERTGSRR
jgi:tRNA uridine 5-carboxymethylaminomethyl modification enzyme